MLTFVPSSLIPSSTVYVLSSVRCHSSLHRGHPALYSPHDSGRGMGSGVQASRLGEKMEFQPPNLVMVVPMPAMSPPTLDQLKSLTLPSLYVELTATTADRATVFIKPVLNTCSGPRIVLGSGDIDAPDRVPEGDRLPSQSTWQYLCFSSVSAMLFSMAFSPAQSPLCLAGALTSWELPPILP